MLPYMMRHNVKSAPSLSRQSKKQDNILLFDSVMNNQKNMLANSPRTQSSTKSLATHHLAKDQNTQFAVRVSPDSGNQSNQFKRSLSSNNTRWNDGNNEQGVHIDYYRPMTTLSRRRLKKKKHSICYSESDKYQKREELESPTASAQVWECFCGHITMLNGMDSISNSSKESYSMNASEIHRKVLKDLKEKTLRRRAKSMITAAKLLKASDKKSLLFEKEEETDSELEEENEMAEKRKIVAQRHWAIIRRDINEKIRIRKEHNVADRSWNILRYQMRATTHAEAVRMELYAKYGVMKNYTKVEPVHKPTISEEAQNLISTFQALEVKNISHSNTEKSKCLSFQE